MIKNLFISLSVFLLFTLSVNAFDIDEDIPATDWNENTELTILNARYGSRFTMSLVTRDNGVYIGSLGYDQDEYTELLIAVETASGRYCFRSATRPDGYKYLLNQQIRPGLTGIQLTGYTDKGLKITATIVSPFTPSTTLDDEQNLKVQIAPVFYVLVDIENKTGDEITGKVNVGLKKKILDSGKTSFNARTWKYNTWAKELYYRDNSSVNNKILLAATDTVNHEHYGVKGFNCLTKEFAIKENKLFYDTLIMASYYDGQVLYDRKYNLPLTYYYTGLWNSLEEVKKYAIENAAKNIGLSQKFENLLMRSDISPEEKWVVAVSFRSDLANAFLLTDKKEKVRFYLAEGRFKHLSTIDVAHETELMAVFSPWRLKLQLDMWLDYMAREEVDRGLSKYGEVHKEGMSASEYGPYLYHDVGDQPYVSETSDYWFGPHMAAEENCNYTLMLYWYWKLTGDDEFVKTKLGMVDILLYSVMNRDTDNDGLVDMGFGWTTYDGADVLKRAPENLFIGVKQLCAYELAAEMFEELLIKTDKDNINYDDVEGVEDGTGVGFETAQLSNEVLRLKQADKYRKEAAKITETFQKAYNENGYLPVSLEKKFSNWNAQSIVIGEGLFLPGLAGYNSENIRKLVPLLADSYQKAFDASKRDNAIGLSTIAKGSSWFSKVMVADIVASYWYDIDQSTARYAYDWNKNNYYAYNDGVKKDGKTPWIGFWYPRGVSSLGYLFRETAFTADKKDEFLKDLK